MGGAEGVIHIHVAEFREAGAERGELRRIGGFRGAVLALHLAFFLDVEAQVFEQHDFTGLQRGAGGFDFRTDAIAEELDRLAEQAGEFLGDRLEREPLGALTVRPAKMAGEHHGAALFQDVLNGRQRRGDAGGVGDFTGLLVLRDIEIDAHKDAFAGDIDVAKRKLGHDLGVRN